MKIFGLEIRRARRVIIVIRKEPEMTGEELTMAFSRVGQRHPLYSAVLQLIDTSIENAYVNANANIKEHAVTAAYIGGAEHLTMLRTDMETRRQQALAAIGRRDPAAARSEI